MEPWSGPLGRTVAGRCRAELDLWSGLVLLPRVRQFRWWEGQLAMWPMGLWFLVRRLGELRFVEAVAQMRCGR